MAWDQIQGQAWATRVVQTHLRTGRVAGAYLLVGPDGVGKRKLALETAKALNCTGSDPPPCDRCVTCGQITRRVHPDVHVLEPSGASRQIKIEDVRQVIGRINLRPFSARVQVVLLDGADRLTAEAGNSLLKSMEEPSAHTHFLLLTSQVSACLPTIVSRCQLIRCQPLPPRVIHTVLSGLAGTEEVEPEAIARLAGGSASRALVLAARWKTHQALIARCAGASTVDWLTERLPESRLEVAQFLEDLLGWLRDLLFAARTECRGIAHAAQQQALRQQAGCLDVDRGLATASALIALHDSLEQYASPRLVAALAREQWLSLFHGRSQRG